MSPSNDVLRSERAAFLAAALAAIGATLDADDLSHDPVSRSDGRLLTAMRQMAELLVECLGAHDRFIRRCVETGHSRLVVGIHYPSDIEMGRISGTAIAETIMHQDDFKAEFEPAKAELRAALGLN